MRINVFWRLAVPLGLLLGLLCGCGGGSNQPSQNQSPTLDTNQPVTGYPDPAVQERRSWNFLVYLDGDADANTDACAMASFNKLETVGSNENVNIIVLYDRAGNSPWSQTRLYYITKDSDTNAIHSTLLGVLGEKNMADPATLRDFLIWCKKYYPADHTLLTLWDHGFGVNPKNVSARNSDKAICIDWTSFYEENGILSNVQVAQALAAARMAGDTHNKVDILFSHACNMQMLEVINDWRNETDYVVGSENAIYLSPNYMDRYVSHFAGSSPTPRELASSIVDDYIESTPDNSSFWHAELSAVETGTKFDTLIERFKTFATALKDTQDTGHVNKAWNELDLMIYTSNVDLDKFALKIAAYTNDSALAAAANNLHAAISDAVAYHRERGYLAGKLSGIAILLSSRTPWNNTFSSGYKDVQLSIDTNWDEFIAKFINYATERPINNV